MISFPSEVDDLVSIKKIPQIELLSPCLSPLHLLVITFQKIRRKRKGETKRMERRNLPIKKKTVFHIFPTNCKGQIRFPCHPCEDYVLLSLTCLPDSVTCLFIFFNHPTNTSTSYVLGTHRQWRCNCELKRYCFSLCGARELVRRLVGTSWQPDKNTSKWINW